MSVTGLREQQSNEWHAWEQRNRETAIERALKHQADMQAATLPHAVNDGKPWSGEDFVHIMRDEPILDIALRLGRTYKSVVRARQRRRRMLGIGITRIKTEDDPYDGSDRRGVLYMEDGT